MDPSGESAATDAEKVARDGMLAGCRRAGAARVLALGFLAASFALGWVLLVAVEPTQARLTANTVEDLAPVFSPDGRQIAFHSSREGNVEIYGMQADGSRQTMLTDVLAGGNFLPDWQPLKLRR